MHFLSLFLVLITLQIQSQWIYAGRPIPCRLKNIQRAGNLKSMFFGGEGLFLTALSGQGTIWLQSLPFSRLADRVLAHAPSAGGTSKGEGSLLGGIGRMLDGK